MKVLLLSAYAARLISELGGRLEDGTVQAPDISNYTIQRLAPRYREALLAVVAAAQDS